MVSKNNKNSKKKINDLKPVIKTSYKKVNLNRKKNTKKIGGGLWSSIKGKLSGAKQDLKSSYTAAKEFSGKAKEGFTKGIGRFRGKGVKQADGTIKFFSRKERGLSRFKIGRNYRSGKQIEDRVNYMTHRINEKKQLYTKVNAKLASKKTEFNMKVKNRFEKLEIEMAEKTAKLEKQLASGKIDKGRFDQEIGNLTKTKEETFQKLQESKQRFIDKHKKLIEKVEENKKNLIKIADKYKPHIEKLSLKLRTKVRKSNKLLDKGLLRTCKKLPKSENCSSQLNKCRPLAGGPNITKGQIIKCMGKIEGFNLAALDKNIKRTKWYSSPYRRIKIRSRAKRIERLKETN